MAKTAVADVIIPTEFERYAIERTAELSHFGDSGIVEHDPAFDEIAMQGGREVKMPFWKDLTATRQLLSDAASLTVNKIFADQDIARLHNDAQVWSVNHLAKVVSGDDPLQAIIDLVAAYWARTDEGLVISCLKGVFGAASMAGNLLAIHSESVAGTSNATRLTGTTFIDACAKLGDASRRLTAITGRSFLSTSIDLIRGGDGCLCRGGVYSSGVTGMYCMNDLMNLAAREGAEEFRLEAGHPPVMVLQGKARALDLPSLTEDNVTELFRSFASPEQIEELRRCGDVRFNHRFQNSAQFAVLAMVKHEHMSLKLKNLGR
jgi:hypothetical protein